jgi:hypothetical protein
MEGHVGGQDFIGDGTQNEKEYKVAAYNRRRLVVNQDIKLA